MKISSLDTLFQDVNGTPVSGVGSPVGMMLDKAEELLERAELVENGSFNGNASGWTDPTGDAQYSIVLGDLVLSAGELFQEVNVSSGKFYNFNVNVNSPYNATTVKLGTTSGAGDIYTFDLSGENSVSRYFRASTSSTYVTLSVPSPADPVTYDNISLKQVAGLHAYQNTSTARPLLQQSNGAYYLDFDGIDDRLLIDLPARIRGTTIFSDLEGTAAYEVSIPSGTFALGTNSPSVTYSFNKNLLGAYTRNIALAEDQISTVFDYYKEGGASAVGANAYQDVFDFGNKWRNAQWLTGFPLIDTSNATSFYASWYNCTNLSSFPLLDSSDVTNFGATWYNCTNLSSFPLIDTSKGTNFGTTWRNCLSLTSFPLINTEKATTLSYAWSRNEKLVSFPLINTSAVGNFDSTWAYCFDLQSFPAIDTQSATFMYGCWNSCNSLSSFPWIDTSKVTRLDLAWAYCGNLSSFPQIDARSALNLNSTWSNCTKLENFPSGVFDNTSGTTNFASTFTGTKLNTQSLDNVLVSINNANTYSGTLNLNSTNMGLPSVPGIAAKYQLENRAWTVNTKAVDSDTAASALFYLDDGAWYDVNDLTTLYQDSLGTTPVTAAGQPVGLMLDKSKGLVLGEEEITNGTFDTDLSDWIVPTGAESLIWVDGTASSSGGGVARGLIQQSVFTLGKSYQITVDVPSFSVGAISIRYRNTDLGGPANNIGTINASGSYTFIHHHYPSRLTTTLFDGILFLFGSTTVGSIDNISVKELPGYHAYQNTSTARPTLQGSAGDYYLDSDLVDDRLLVDLPAISGTAVIASEEGTAAYGVNFPAGTHALITNTSAVTYSFAKDLVGQFIRERAMGPTEVSAAYDYFTAKNAGPVGENAYSGVTNLINYWRGSDWLVEMPVINTSNVTNMYVAWYECVNLSSFPLIDTSKVTNMQQTWQNCFALKSFPALNTSSVLGFPSAWQGCTSLESFPLIDTSKATSFNNAWASCRSLSSFPAVDSSKVTIFNGAWNRCNNLSSFPLIDTSKGTTFYAAWFENTSLSSFPLLNFESATSLLQTWYGCTALESFPAINTSAVTNFQQSWNSCISLTSFPLIDTSKGISFASTWNSCIGLTSFPAINTSSATTMYYTWAGNRSLTSFPQIDTSQVTNFHRTWLECWSLSSFPALDFRSATELYQTFYGCNQLTDFPAGCFDNTSGTVTFSDTFQGTKLNTQSVDNIIVSINNADTSSGTLNLSVGSQQPPSYWGIAASGELESRGWNVTTKTPTAEDQLDATIAPLYITGDDGAWYDVNDLDTMFEDSKGTIPVTGAGQPVGLLLDKSKGLQLGNDIVTNGTFDTSSDWILGAGWSISEGRLTASSVAFIVEAKQNLPELELGKRYLVSFDVTVTSGTLKVNLGQTGYSPTELFINSTGSYSYRVPYHNSKHIVFWPASTFTGSVDNVSVRELPGNHAYQSTSTARPVLEGSAGAYYLDAQIDDYLTTNLPPVTGEAVVSTQRGTVKYQVSADGPWSIIQNSPGVPYLFQYELIGTTLRDGGMTSAQTDSIYQYFQNKGAGSYGTSAFGAETNLSNYWRTAKWIIGDFPLIDTSNNLYYTFTFADTSISSMPLIDTSKGISFNGTWYNCINLVSFPLIDTSQGTSFTQTWRSCRSLSSFPLINTESAITLASTWYDCRNLQSFPLIDTSNVISVQGAWRACFALSSFPEIDTSKVYGFEAAWYDCRSLTEFPLLDTSNGEDFQETWRGCYSLTSFPQLNTSAGTTFTLAWGVCSNLSSFPQLDFRSATNMNSAWSQCTSLEVFPSGCFDNTSGTVNFSTTFNNTKLNSSSLDNVLVSINNANTASGTLNLNSTNMQTPGVAGTAAKFKLQGRDWEVNTKAIDTDTQASALYHFDDGAWYDVNDLSTMFEDYRGTIPVTGAGQPVGLLLDKSKGLVLGEELWSGGSITAESGWVDNLDGSYTATSSTDRLYSPVGITENKVYTVSFTISNYSNGDLQTGSGSTFKRAYITGNGNYSVTYRQATTTGGNLLFDGVFPSFTGTISNISVKEIPGYHAYQSTSTARPTLQGSAGDYYLDSDLVDDRLLVDLPAISGTAVIASEEGTAAYGVSFPAGTHSLITNTSAVTFSFAKDLVGQMIREGAMNSSEVSAAYDYFVDQNAGPVGENAYTGRTYFAEYWRNAGWITDFPVINMSSATNIAYSWKDCTSLTTFPLIDTSQVTNFRGAWNNCNSLPSFPLLNTSAGTDFLQSWSFCQSLSSFPLIDTSQGLSFQQAWQGCNSLSSFPLLDTGNVVNLNYAWASCSNLSSFPLIETGSVTSMYETWGSCTNLESIPTLNTSSLITMGRIFYGCPNLRTFPQWDTLNVTSMLQSWYGCQSLSSFPLLDTRNVTNISNAWYNCTSLTSFPLLNTSSVTGIGFNSAWRFCSNISSFPEIDTSQGETFTRTWERNLGLSSFPLLDFGSATSLDYAWDSCTSLTSFPQINTANVTNLTRSWYDCVGLSSFPAINTSAVTNMNGTWYDCENLISFPQINTSQVTNFLYSWRHCYALTSFPLIDTSQGQDFYFAWYACRNLSSFPAIDCRSATRVNHAWSQCTSLEYFPAGVFDNTSGTVDFSDAFYNSKLNTQSVDNIIVSINNADTSSGNIALNSTNMQPPSYWGIAASGELESRGWDVGTKTPSASALEDSEIAAMFFSGDEGAWYDPADFSTMFQDSAGTTPVTASGQPVGLILDKSKGLQLGNELVTNGTFDTSSDWTLGGGWLISDGVAEHPSDSGAGDLRQYIPMTNGKYYKIKLDIVSNTGNQIASIRINAKTLVSNITGTGTYEFIYQKQSTENGDFIIAAVNLSECIIDNISVRELPGNHASQATSTARPILQVDASGNYYLDGDGVDDYLAVTVPQIIGKKIVASPEGTVVYGVNIPSGTHALFRNDVGLSFEPYTDVFGEIFSTNPFDTSISSTVIEYLQNRGGGPSGADAYGGITSLIDRWRESDWLTEMPLIDTSQATSFFYTWFNCHNLSSFPALNTSAVINFQAAWASCYNLSSFPLIDTSKATTVFLAWNGCTSLTSFPEINTSAVTNFGSAWNNCNKLTSFPALNASAVTSFNGAWQNCTSLSSFPLIDTGKGTNFFQTWINCNNLSSFPEINTSSATNFSRTWQGCSRLTSFPLIDTGNVTTFLSTWGYCYALSSFPLIDTSKGTTFEFAWTDCTSLSSFPAINTSAGTNFRETWRDCTSLSSFPVIDTGQGVNFLYAWNNCRSLTSFPLLNTSQGTNFAYAWQNCFSLLDFPLIDTSQATLLNNTWEGCTSLSSFPAINTSAVTNFGVAWYGCNNLSSFPVISTIAATTLQSTWQNCTSLTDFPANVFDNTPCTNFTNAFLNCALTQTSVDNILVSINAAGTSNGTLNMTGGTSSAPSATGLAAKAALESRGWTVTTN